MGSHLEDEGFSGTVDVIFDLLLPETDAGVAAQVLLVLGLWGLFIWRVRSSSAWRLVAIGSGLVALGLIGLRALH